MASYVGLGVSASVNLARASAEERRRRERVGHLCDSGYNAEEESCCAAREENLEQRGDSEVLRVPEDRASSEGLPRHKEDKERDGVGDTR